MKKIKKAIAGLTIILIAALVIYGAVDMIWPGFWQRGPNPAELPGGRLVVQFCDVGQGDAALLLCDGHAMLIDGGDREHSDYMYSMLQSKGINKLDIVVATHSDADHIGGLAGALNYATADLVLCPILNDDGWIFRNFKEYTETNGPGITVPEAGAEYDLGGAKVQVLGLNAGAGDNDASIIIRVVYGSRAFIFMADAETEAEDAIIYSGRNIEADVIKVAHHGSGTSTSFDLLDAVEPEIAVISVGENEWGHPHNSVLGRLRSVGAEIYRTDERGDITITTDGAELEIETQR